MVARYQPGLRTQFDRDLARAVLQKVVDLLKARNDLSSAMFYVSDHGKPLAFA